MIDLWILCEAPYGYISCCITCKEEEIAENLEYAMCTHGMIINWFTTPAVQTNV